jgi:cytochrome c biogenesis protein ResB
LLSSSLIFSSFCFFFLSLFRFLVISLSRCSAAAPPPPLSRRRRHFRAAAVAPPPPRPAIFRYFEISKSRHFEISPPLSAAAPPLSAA